MVFEKLKKRWKDEAHKQRQRSESIEQNLMNTAPLLKKYGIQEIYLFGSFAEHRSNNNSDIDLYVAPLANTKYWQFRFELEEALNTPIDLYTNLDDKKFIAKVKNRGKKIYEA